MLCTGLAGWGLTSAAQSQSLTQEVTVRVRPIQDQGYLLYGLDARIQGQPHTLLLDTGAQEHWIDARQTPVTADPAGMSYQVGYADGGQIQGGRTQALLSLGTWQQTLPLLVARSLEGPAASIVQTVRRTLAQGLLGLAPGALPGVRRFSLQLGGGQSALTLNPSFYASSVTLPYAGRDARVFLGQDLPVQTLLDSGSAFVMMRPAVAQTLGISTADLAPFKLAVRPDIALSLITRTVRFRLGKLRLRFDPPRMLVVQNAPPDTLHDLDLILGIPFLEQVQATWDLSQQVIYIGEHP